MGKDANYNSRSMSDQLKAKGSDFNINGEKFLSKITNFSISHHPHPHTHTHIHNINSENRVDEGKTTHNRIQLFRY